MLVVLYNSRDTELARFKTSRKSVTLGDVLIKTGWVLQEGDYFKAQEDDKYTYYDDDLGLFITEKQRRERYGRCIV